MYTFWIVTAIVVTFLATVCYYELKVVNLELEIDQLKREQPAPLPFNVVEFKPESGTRYERELMADINKPDLAADGYSWPTDSGIPFGPVERRRHDLPMPFSKAEIDTWQ